MHGPHLRRTSCHVRYEPGLLAQAVTYWLHWESVLIRRGNPYLSDEDAMALAVRHLRHNYPHIHGTLRHRDGRVIETVEPPKMRPDPAAAKALETALVAARQAYEAERARRATPPPPPVEPAMPLIVARPSWD